MLGEQYLSQQSTPTTNPQSSPTIDATTQFDGNGRPVVSTGFDGTTAVTVYDPVTGQVGAQFTDVAQPKDSGNHRTYAYVPGKDPKTVERFVEQTNVNGTLSIVPISSPVS